MTAHTHRTTTRTFLAVVTAFLALIVGSLLSAGPASAQVPPPEVVAPTTVHHGTSLSSVINAAWPTYVLIALVVVAVGVALRYGLTRARLVHPSASAAK